MISGENGALAAGRRWSSGEVFFRLRFFGGRVMGAATSLQQEVEALPSTDNEIKVDLTLLLKLFALTAARWVALAFRLGYVV